MSKPLTIEELKSLEIGEWVWVKFVIENSIDKEYASREKYFQIIDPENDTAIRFNRFVPMPYSTYGNTWVAYKNKEQADGKQLAEPPCKIGDTAYLIYSSEQREPIPFVVDFIITHQRREEERLFVYDSDGYGGRFGDCSKGSYVWYIGTDKAQAEARLKELKGE